MKFNKNIIILLSLLLVTSSCATSVRKDDRRRESSKGKGEDLIARRIETDSYEIRRVYELAEDSLTRGDADIALQVFHDFISRYPDSDLTDNAYFRMGEIQLKKEDYQGAVESFQKVITDYVDSDVLVDAKYRLAIVFFKRGEYNDAIQTLKSLLELPLERSMQGAVMATIADSYLNLQKNNEALTWYGRALEKSSGEDLAGKIEKRVFNVVQKRVPVKMLGGLENSFSGTFIGDVVTYSMIMGLIDEAKYDEAKSRTSSLINRTESEMIRARGDEILELIAQRMDVKADTIGCILPLSGTYAAYGKKVLKGIQLAAGIFSSEAGVPVKLIIKDSKGSAEGAAKLVDELVDEDKVIAIVGPLFGSVAESAAERAQERGVPMMTLSKKEGLPYVGDYIFRNFLTSRLQTRSIAEYSINELGLKSFAIIYPEDNFGEEMMSLFWNDVLLLGGEVVGIEGYDRKKYDFASEIRMLVGTDKTNKKEEEEKDELDKTFPVVDFDAVFIPDSYDKAAVIAPQFAYNNVEGIRLIGPNSWNSAKFIKMGGGYVEGALFTGGFYPNSKYEGARTFTEDFKNVFGDEPGTLEANSYDAARMIVQFIKSGQAKSRIEMRDELLLISNFKGATGITSVNETGDVEKKLFILTVDNEEIKEVDAPGWFREESISEDKVPLLQ